MDDVKVKSMSTFSMSTENVFLLLTKTTHNRRLRFPEVRKKFKPNGSSTKKFFQKSNCLQNISQLTQINVSWSGQTTCQNIN